MLDFNLVSEFTPIQRRSFEVATVDGAGVSIINPNSANPLLMGEWLELNASSQLIRGAGNGATGPSFVCLGERGRTDMQALGKAPVGFMGDYEAETLIMDASGLSVGSALMVNDVTFGSLTRRGLILQAGGGLTVARVTRLPANNNGYLRFQKVSN